MTKGSGEVSSDLAPTAGGRIISIDVLRGLTILLMIFVNDLGPACPLLDAPHKAFQGRRHDSGRRGVPGISVHRRGVDPAGIRTGAAAGKTSWAQFGHILIRTAGLLFMGVIVYNSEDSHTQGQPLWGMLAFIAIILAWCDVPREHTAKRTVLIVIKALGIAGLVLPCWSLYRREPGTAEVPFFGRVEGWVWMQTGWWGILGLIGWAYLTAATLTLLLGRRREWMMGALAILMFLHLAMQQGGLFTRLDDKPWLGGAVQPLKVLAEGVSSINELRQSGRRLGLFGRGHDGRLPARDDPPARQRRRDSSRSAFLGRDVHYRPFAGRACHGYIRGHQQNRGDADLVLLVGRANLRHLDASLSSHRCGGVSRLVDPRPTRRGQSAGRLLPASDHRRVPFHGRTGGHRPEIQELTPSLGGRCRLDSDGGVRLRRHGPNRATGSAGATLRDVRS